MKPIYRYRFSKYLWRCSRHLTGYRCANPRGDYTMNYRQIFGPLFRVDATEDCHTTGAPIGYIDPAKLTFI